MEKLKISQKIVVPSLLGKLTPVPDVPSDTFGVSELVEEDSAEVDEPLGASDLKRYSFSWCWSWCGNS